ncbi:hypothetical protein E2C01_095470 [Portunus trituberculatus]|uniref:Uncharacterized protein n=1 Tax=Portunus trituberculatus TaxID=210409 RepID=A0A5B7JPW8_PORTR|nr:hypothetical protein [Portunus trituberculatus]
MPIDCTRVIKPDMSACGHHQFHQVTAVGQDRTRAITARSRHLYHGAAQVEHTLIDLVREQSPLWKISHANYTSSIILGTAP